jgi:ribose 5-phosphate isomerase
MPHWESRPGFDVPTEPVERVAWDDPAALAEKLRAIPGIVEHGLFIGMAEMALIGKDGGVVRLQG